MNSENVLFPGCLVTSRFPEYELSSKLVLDHLGIKNRLLPGLMCCGQVVQGVTPSWIYMAAYNLALAEKHHMDVITLCGGCTNTFKRVQYMCRQNPRKLNDINKVLNQVGLEFNNTVQTRHLLEVLGGSESDLLAGFKKTIPVKAALVHPCQIFRPAEVMQFDDADHPRVMEKLVQAAAKSLVGYSFQNRCCGASLTMSNLAAAYQIGRTRLEELAAKGAEVIITACGNCHLLLHCRQSEYYNGRPIPCLFLPQLLGLALGFSADDLMIYDAQLRSLTGNV